MPFKKYSPKQKKLARVAPPRNKITGADLKKLRAKPKKEGKEKIMPIVIMTREQAKRHRGPTKKKKPPMKSKGGQMSRAKKKPMKKRRM